MAQAHSVMHITIQACFLCFFYNPYMSLFSSKNFSFTCIYISIHTNTFRYSSSKRVSDYVQCGLNLNPSLVHNIILILNNGLITISSKGVNVNSCGQVLIPSFQRNLCRYLSQSIGTTDIEENLIHGSDLYVSML